MNCESCLPSLRPAAATVPAMAYLPAEWIAALGFESNFLRQARASLTILQALIAKGDMG